MNKLPNIHPGVILKEEFLDAFGISAYKLAKEIKIPQNVEGELFHIAMEALNNTLKHAKASEIVLSLQSDEKFFVLKIEDNGRGFNPELTKKKGGVGISSMTERAKKIGGSLSIQSEDGVGTIITIRVPLETEPNSSKLNPKENIDG